MYHRLGADLVDMNVLIDQESHMEIDLYAGQFIAEPINGPIDFSIEIDEDENGVPEEPKLYAYFPNVSLMSKDLVKVLQDSGVDNLQTIPAIITNPNTGHVIDQYLAVNVVGLVSCADMAQSDAEPLADVHYFQKLVIDQSRTNNLLVFRLAESQMEVIVHETVARAIKSNNLPGLELEPLQST